MRVHEARYGKQTASFDDLCATPGRLLGGSPLQLGEPLGSIGDDVPDLADPTVSQMQIDGSTDEPRYIQVQDVHASNDPFHEARIGPVFGNRSCFNESIGHDLDMRGEERR